MVHAPPNGVNCVKGEIHNVLSVMRVNARWASTSRFKREIPTHTQSPLLRRFKELHVQLEGVIDLSDVDTLNILEPFVLVIESEKTSGIITGAAVSSLNKFLLYGLIRPDGLRATEAINRIALCVSRCRFEETHRDVDEMVLMKLMELLECCVRCEAGKLISGENIWKMVHTCYSISCQPRASMHLSHTAENTLAHVILTVFDRIADMDPLTHSAMDNEELEREDNESEVVVPYGIPVLEQLLTFLSDLIKPKEKEDTTILGLSLINIVLETAGTALGAHPTLVHVLQGNLSKYLLQNSETSELHVLSLTLRVVFNLFNSIKDHLKVQLEVFFTSVHMRIIESPSCSDEQKELALESLLEFCREPALMLDLYINYDCDVHCTNLFEVLCKALARNTQVSTVAPTSPDSTAPPVFNILNLLALEGLLAVLESIARRCPLTSSSSILDVTGHGLAQMMEPQSSNPLPHVSPMSSIREVMQIVMSDTESDTDVNLGSNMDQLAWLHTARERTAEILQQSEKHTIFIILTMGRKQSKKRYSLAADKFHNEPKNWIAYSQQLGLLPNPVTAEAVASFFHTTPGLDKTKIGEYLGEGPEDKYPFHAQVRDAYAGMFNFQKTSLDEALRLYLSKFRLPGEAQKIDRMMEAFSKEYFRQIQLGSIDQPLADADAAFILSFSIIMLNTDLHSDHIQRKMTVDEFVRNNRGINAGQDLPREYLVNLYDNLKASQIKMQTDVSDLNDDAIPTVDRYSEQWEGVLKRQENVVGASFTSNASVLKLRAGRHEREMFSLIMDTTTASILTAFERTGDESTMSKAMDGISNATKIAIYFQMVPEFNKLIAALAAYFVEFAHGVMNGERVHLPTVETGTKRNRTGSDKGDSVHVILREEERQSGRKTSRTLRTLQLLFDIVAKYADCLRVDAWTSVVECILIFNELDIAPTSLVEMDDFVDSRGVPLPPANVQLSPRSQQALAAGVSGKTRERSRRLAERQAAHRQQRYHNQSLSSSGNMSSGSFWDSLSSYLWSEEEEEVDLNYPLVSNALRECVSTCGNGLLERDAWFRMCRKLSNESCLALLESLLAARDPFKSVVQHSTGMVDWMMQENAILALELGINLVLVNIHRFTTLWPAVHTYVARILHSKADFEMTLLVERVVVNVLRVCIRLFHDEAARPMLLDTLILLKDLDHQVLLVLSERLTAGLHMLIKANAMYLHTMPHSTWETLFGLLGLVAQYPNGWPATLDALKQLQVDGMSKDIVGLWTGVCMRLINQNTGHEVDALKLLYIVANSESAERCWIDLMRILLSYLQDERPLVARTAWDCLYRSLMLPGHPIPPSMWKDCFEEIIYTLDDRSRDLATSNTPSKDLSIYSTTLLSKVFLYNIHTLADLPCFHTLWLNVLRRLATKLAVPPIATTSVDALEVYEMTLHALHNLLVVMTAEGIFESSSERSQQDVLQLSYDLIRSVCPQVLDQLSFESGLPEVTEENNASTTEVEQVATEQADQVPETEQ
ncbi:hypothetical protein THRCLA_07373 [Thraustotheca clavata]|uniref:SEC7 domain-containing protein n=1 Tax=Thraustotheca clavata TaxID=74557 RepID=A0A1V9ZDS2_9STRA|nr:hypothetical protein THRCLA_07373 [Thraustotheca clavata]